MNNIPSGRVTFLFSDIENSTMLSQEFAEQMSEAFLRHNEVLQRVVESHNGFIFKTIGDSFCCAFSDPYEALIAGIEAQQKISTEKWKDVQIKDRMGIHSGTAEWRSADYMGYVTLARVQRIMSSAYGGQIIISNDTYELIKERFSIAHHEIYNEGNQIVSFRDLGERRLKDLIQPVKLYQIIATGLREEFPPLKTLDARPNNLPVQLTSFIGREEEMKQLKILLKQTPLLTLTGSGGVGKTRIALQIAADLIDDFAHGVWFTELALLLEPALLPQALMKLFGLKEEVKRSW